MHHFVPMRARVVLFYNVIPFVFDANYSLCFRSGIKRPCWLNSAGIRAMAVMSCDSNDERKWEFQILEYVKLNGRWNIFQLIQLFAMFQLFKYAQTDGECRWNDSIHLWIFLMDTISMQYPQSKARSQKRMIEINSRVNGQRSNFRV